MSKNTVTPVCMRERDAAVYLGMCAATLRRARMEGQNMVGPPFVKVPGARCILYRVADLDKWLEDNVQGREVVQ